MGNQAVAPTKWDSARAGPEGPPGPLTHAVGERVLRRHELQFGTQNRVSGDRMGRQIAYRSISPPPANDPPLVDPRSMGCPFFGVPAPCDKAHAAGYQPSNACKVVGNSFPQPTPVGERRMWRIESVQAAPSGASHDPVLAEQMCGIPASRKWDESSTSNRRSARFADDREDVERHACGEHPCGGEQRKSSHRLNLSRSCVS